MTVRLVAWVALATLALSSQPTVAELNISAALVVGVDHYQHETALRGAVADARDIAAALQRGGVTQTILLTDGDATRERVEDAWRVMLEHARAGDRLLFSFAGHGTKEPELKPGSEPDGFDEVLVLSGFYLATKTGLAERLVDNEIGDWTRAAATKGVQVMVVVDACHSGKIVRSIDPRGTMPQLRWVAPIAATREQLMAADAPYWQAAAGRDSGPLVRTNTLAVASHRSRSVGLATDSGAKPFPGTTAGARARPGENVLQLSATLDDEEAPEVLIDDGRGQKVYRGALSFSFARALEGRADLDGNGITTIKTLRLYIRNNVRDLVGARQTPVVFPDDPAKDNDVVFGDAGEKVPPAAAAPAAEFVVAVIDPGSVDAARAALRDLDSVTVDTDRIRADLIWDPKAREVVTGRAELAAQEIGADRLRAVVQKWRAVKRFQETAIKAPMVAAVWPNDGSHPGGENVRLSLTEFTFANLVLFNLAGDGSVQFLYPLPTDPASIPSDRAFELPLCVTPPFGADHFVAIATAAPVPRLLALLKARNGQPASGDLDAAIMRELGATPYRMVVQGLYTVPGQRYVLPEELCRNGDR